MRVSRLYVEGPIVSGQPLALEGERAHYLQQVLRVRPGDGLHLFSGNGLQWPATVVQSSARRVVVMPEDCEPGETDSALIIHLGVGLARGERMDWIIQKSTELGVDSVTPLQLTRCTARSKTDRLEKRMRHWQQVAISACEQSGRNRLPVINEPSSLSNWLSKCHSALRVVMTPDCQSTLQLPAEIPTIDLLTGPEGGFDDSELEAVATAGFVTWQLGPRVLRAETAPIAALAVLQFTLGDLTETDSVPGPPAY